jgi:hypothetical protein
MAASLSKGRIPCPSMEFLCRACLTALLVIVTLHLSWGGLRFLTSEAILRLSAVVGMTTARISFDAIELQGQFFRFTVSCTFADVFMGTLPLIWRLDRSIIRNLLRVAVVAVVLFVFNVTRLEVGQIAYSRGVLWLLAHEIPSGFAYFGVWIAIWRSRSWPAWQYLVVGTRHPHLGFETLDS